MLTLSRADLPRERQDEFGAALESGRPVWYQDQCWIVLECRGLVTERMSFVLTQVPDRECGR